MTTVFAAVHESAGDNRCASHEIHGHQLLQMRRIDQGQYPTFCLDIWEHPTQLGIGVVGARFSHTGDPATGAFGDAEVDGKFGQVPMI
jgi:hypothetical protein